MLAKLSIFFSETLYSKGLLDELDDLRRIYFPFVGFIQQFGHINIVPKWGIGVTYNLVPSWVYAKDILKDNEDPTSLPNMVNFDSGNAFILSDRLVVESEGWPGARGTALDCFLVAAGTVGLGRVRVNAAHEG